MQTCSCASNPVTEDPDPIWIYVRYGPDTLVIHRPTHGWSGDPYRFVQWRPDSDSVSKPYHFMWVFAFGLFLYLPLSIYICSTFIFSCDYLMYYNSVIICITSWGISDCLPYLCSWYEFVSASFHVLVVCRCWLRPSIGIS